MDRTCRLLCAIFVVVVVVVAVVVVVIDRQSGGRAHHSHQHLDEHDDLNHSRGGGSAAQSRSSHRNPEPGWPPARWDRQPGLATAVRLNDTTLAYRFDSNVLTASFSFCFLFIRTRKLRVLRNVLMRNSCSIIMLHFVTFSVHCYSVMPCSTSFSNNNASSTTHGHSFWPLSLRSSLFCEGLTRSRWTRRRTEVSVCPCQASEAFAPSLLRPSESISPSLIHTSRFQVQRIISGIITITQFLVS